MPRPTPCATTDAGGSTSKASIACGAPRRARCSRSARTIPRARCSAPTRSVRCADRCAARDAALILDEVFADYPLGDPRGLKTPGPRVTSVSPPGVVQGPPGGPGVFIRHRIPVAPAVFRPRATPALPDIPARRPVQVGGAAAGEARLDRRRRPGPARRGSARAARVHLRHLPVGVDAGADRRAGADCRRRGSARADPRPGARQRCDLASTVRGVSRPSTSCTPTRDGRRCCAWRRQRAKRR